MQIRRILFIYICLKAFEAGFPIKLTLNLQSENAGVLAILL